MRRKELKEEYTGAVEVGAMTRKLMQNETDARLGLHPSESQRHTALPLTLMFGIAGTRVP
jgi:hypothetical protein